MPEQHTAPEAFMQSILEPLLPHLLRDHGFLDVLHLCSVAFQKNGDPETARRLFHLIEPHAGPYPALHAWTWYKEAERLQEAGEKDAARRVLERVLAIEPGHQKARLALLPASEPLHVAVGDRPTWPVPALFIPFPLGNPGVWAYYFKDRPAESLWFCPPLRLRETEVTVIETVARHYLTPQGVVVLAIAGGRRTDLSREALLAACAKGTEHFHATVDAHLRELLF